MQEETAVVVEQGWGCVTLKHQQSVFQECLSSMDEWSFSTEYTHPKTDQPSFSVSAKTGLSANRFSVKQVQQSTLGYWGRQLGATLHWFSFFCTPEQPRVAERQQGRLPDAPHCRPQDLCFPPHLVPSSEPKPNAPMLSFLCQVSLIWSPRSLQPTSTGQYYNNKKIKLNGMFKYYLLYFFLSNPSNLFLHLVRDSGCESQIPVLW